MIDEHKLTRLLRDADADVPPVGLIPAERLATDARRMAHAARGRARLAVASCAAVGVLIVTLIANLRPPHSTEANLASHDPEELRARLAVLAGDADERNAVIDFVQKDERRRARASAALAVRRPTHNAPVDFASARQRAAAALLIDVQRTATPDDRARQSLQRIIDLFPETTAASTARQQLQSAPAGRTT